MTQLKTPAKPATRQEVAKAAGVSLTTVTNALKKDPRVKEKTRRRIMDIADELGYRPSFAGQALVSGKNYSVGLLHPTGDYEGFEFYNEIMMGLVHIMHHDEYGLQLMYRDENHRYLKAVEQGRVDGMFVLQSDLENTYIEKVIGSGIPTVVINREFNVSDRPGVGCVHSDHEKMISEAVGKLADAGCRRITAIHDYTMCDANNTIFRTFADVLAGMADRGVVGSTIIPSHQNMTKQVENMLDAGERFDGVFIDGITKASIFLDTMAKRGLEAGRDFQLVTTEYKNRTTEGFRELCSFSQQPQVMAKEAWTLMQELIANPFPRQREIRVPYLYQERNG